VEIVVAIVETCRHIYWLYSAPECGLFAFYDGTTAFDQVPRAVLEEISAAKRVGEFKIEVRRERGMPIYVNGKCVGVRLRPRLVVLRGKYGVYVVRGREVPLVPGEDLQLIFSTI